MIDRYGIMTRPAWYYAKAYAAYSHEMMDGSLAGACRAGMISSILAFFNDELNRALCAFYGVEQ